MKTVFTGYKSDISCFIKIFSLRILNNIPFAFKQDTKSQLFNTLSTSTSSEVQSTGCSSSNLATSLNGVVDGLFNTGSTTVGSKIQELVAKFTSLSSNTQVSSYLTSFKAIMNGIQDCSTSMVDKIRIRNNELTTSVKGKIDAGKNNYRDKITIAKSGNATTCENSNTGTILTTTLENQSSIRGLQSAAQSSYIGKFGSMITCAIDAITKAYQLSSSLSSCSTSTSNSTAEVCVTSAVSFNKFSESFSV